MCSDVLGVVTSPTAPDQSVALAVEERDAKRGLRTPKTSKKKRKNPLHRNVLLHRASSLEATAYCSKKLPKEAVQNERKFRRWISPGPSVRTSSVTGEPSADESK